MPRLRNRTTIAFVLSISLVILIFFKIKPDLHAHFEVDNGDSSVRQLQREVNQNDGHQYMLEKQNFQYKDSKNEVQKVEEKNDMVHGDYEEDEDDKGWNFWNPMKKSNENDDTCRKRQTIKRLKSMSKSMGKSFVARIPIFLEQSLLQSADIQEFKVPFGVYGAESNFSDALQLLSNSALPVEVTNISCARCVIVGSGSVIKNTGLGPNIDKYDVVIRVNGGPVYSYESDVGTRTTIRISHPEGAPAKLDDYDPNAIFVLVAFKPVDLQWATLVATHDKVDLTVSVYNI
ncbi:lactosylceramide alpha-2,3-sialyltransferase-like [Saccoglossus kowalevskii]